MIQVGVVGGDGDGRPGIRPEGGEGFGRRPPMIADGKRRRRFRPLRPDEIYGPAFGQTQGGDRQGEGIGTHDDQSLGRLVEATAFDPLAGHPDGPVVSIADIEDGASLRLGVAQFRQGRIVRIEPFDEQVQASAAGQARVDERAATTVDDSARLSVFERGPGMEDDIGLDASARQEAAGV